MIRGDRKDGISIKRVVVSLSDLRSGFLSGSLLIFLGLVLNRGFGFVSHIIIARIFGPVGFGGIAIGLTLLAFGSVLGSAGLHQGLARYLPRLSEDERSTVATTGFQLATGISLVVAAALFGTAPWIAPFLGGSGIVPVIRVFAVAIPMQVLLKLSVGVIRGSKRTRPKVLVSNVLLPVVRLLLVVAVIFVGLGQVGIAVAYVGAFGFAAIAGVSYVYRLLGFDYCTGITDESYSMIRFSAPLLVGGATSLVVTDLDVLMLGAMVNSSAVGTYKAVYPLALLLNMTLISVGYLLMPVLSDLHSEGNASRMREVYRICAKWITALSIPLVYAFLVYPDWVIGLTFGSEYVSGSQALSVLSLGFVTHATTGPNGDALKSLGYSDVTMYTSIALGLLNAGLNLLLIPRFSIVGAAVATALSYFINNLLNGYILYARSGISPLSKGLVVVLTAGVGSALFVSVASQASSLISRSALVSLLTFCVVYAVVVGIMGGLQQDVQLVKGLI